MAFSNSSTVFPGPVKIISFEVQNSNAFINSPAEAISKPETLFNDFINFKTSLLGFAFMA